jgi:hypothetical protein
MTALFGGYVADEASGRFVSERHVTVATILQDYNPNLHLVWLPPEVRIPGDEGKEFAVVHKGDTEHHKDYVVRYCREDEVDERLLAWIWENDSQKHDILSRLEMMDMAAAMIEAKQEEERAAERQDMIATVIKSPLHTYKMPNGKIIRS